MTQISMYVLEGLIFLNFVWKISAKCSNKEDCSSHGSCDNGSCFCEQFYSGNDCSQSWRSDSAWVSVFWVHAVVVAVMHTLFDIWIIAQLFITFRYAEEGKWKVWNITTIGLITAFFGCLFRAIDYYVDPFGYRDIVGSIGSGIMFQLALILFFVTGMMVFLYWVELQKEKGVHHVLFVSKYKPVLIIFVFFISIVLFSLSIWRSVSNSPAAQALINIFFAFIFLIIIGVSSWGAFSLMKAIKSSASMRATGASNQFTIKLLRYIVASDTIWVITIVTLIIYVAISGNTQRWSFLGFNIAFRIEEFITIMLFLWFIRKRKPDSQSLPRSIRPSMVASKSMSSASVEMEVSKPSYSKSRPEAMTITEFKEPSTQTASQSKDEEEVMEQ